MAGSGEYGNTSYENNAVWEYDPAADTWTMKKPMPAKRDDFVMAACETKIYLIGGSSGANQAYDPATDTWETKASMPTPRSSLEANMVNGKIYLIGGRTGGQYSTVGINEVYNPATDTWATKTPIPYPVTSYASAVVDNKIYVIGGQDEFNSPMNLALVQIYDPERDAWSFGAPMLTVVRQAAAGATTGIWAPKRIYVIGGLPDKSMEGTDINQVYDSENDSWTFGASMPSARFDLSIAVLNDTIYAMRGLPYFNLQGVYCLENEQYTPIGYGTIQPSPSPTPPTLSEPFPTAWIAAAVAATAIGGAFFAVYYLMKNRKTKKQ
jgi:N-acetylneuraminic acid mutarotase